MADISVINVGGVDRNVKDTTSRTNSNNALSQIAYVENGNTASQPYPTIGTPINWKGTLYYTKTAVASGAAWVVGTNLTAAGNLGKLTSNIKTYVNSSGELVFRDLTGADTVLPFKGTNAEYKQISASGGSVTLTKGQQIWFGLTANTGIYINGVAITNIQSIFDVKYHDFSYCGGWFTVKTTNTYTWTGGSGNLHLIIFNEPVFP